MMCVALFCASICFPSTHAQWSVQGTGTTTNVGTTQQFPVVFTVYQPFALASPPNSVKLTFSSIASGCTTTVQGLTFYKNSTTLITVSASVTVSAACNGYLMMPGVVFVMQTMLGSTNLVLVCLRNWVYFSPPTLTSVTVQDNAEHFFSSNNVIPGLTVQVLLAGKGFSTWNSLPNVVQVGSVTLKNCAMVTVSSGTLINCTYNVPGTMPSTPFVPVSVSFAGYPQYASTCATCSIGVTSISSVTTSSGGLQCAGECTVTVVGYNFPIENTGLISMAGPTQDPFQCSPISTQQLQCSFFYQETVSFQVFLYFNPFSVPNAILQCPPNLDCNVGYLAQQENS